MFSIFEISTLACLYLFSLLSCILLNKNSLPIDNKCLFAKNQTKVAVRYRVLVSVFMTFYMVTTEITIRFELFYFTHQCYLLTTLYFIIVSTCDPEVYLIQRKSKLIYFLYVLSLNGSFLSGFNYWVFVAKNTVYVNNIWLLIWFGGNAHGLSFLFLVIDMIFFNRIPLYYSSVLFVTIFFFFYCLFHLLFKCFNVVSIYPFADPHTQSGYIFCFVMPILPFVVHLVPWTLSSIRDIALCKLNYSETNIVMFNEDKEKQ